MAMNTQRRPVAADPTSFIASRAALRSLLECSFDGLLIVDRTGRIREANLPACRIFGQSMDSIIGKRVRDIGSVRQRAVAHRSGMPDAADRSETVVTMERPDQSSVDVVIRKIPGLAARTRIWILRDVTADRSLVEALERKSRLLIEAERVGGMGGWEVDVKSGLLAWTPEMRRIMGMPATTETMTIEQSYNFYTDASRPIVREAFNATMARGTPYDLELEAVTGQGKRIWVREVCRATMHRGRVVSVIGFSQDITERRRLAGLLDTIGNQERARIGADLHDGLGQELTGMSLLLRGVSTRAEHEGSTLVGELRGLTKLASKSVKSVRDIAHGLLPLELSDAGFRQVLKRLARATSETFGVLVTIRFQGDGPNMPSGTVAENLYRIAQEAITNAVKHGHAKRIWLRVHVGEAKTIFTASDDGTGIDLSRNSEGMGLQIMHYRARMLGGMIDLQRTRTGGTRVRCVLPRNRLCC
jgi:PAS domain S-box-containing protein